VNPQPWEARLARLEGVSVQGGERLNSIDRRLDTIEHMLQSRDEGVQSRFGQLESRFGQLEQSTSSRLGQLEQAMNSRFAQVDARFALIDQRLTWLIGIVVGTWITTILTVLFHH